MGRLLLLLIPIILIGAVAAFLLNGNKVSTTEPLKGISFSPKSTTGSDITAFFDEAKSIGNTVTWAGDWNELGNTNGAPALVVTEATKRSLTPIIIVTAFRDQGNSVVPIKPLTAATRQSYVDLATAFVKKYHPRYFGVGIEINRLSEADAANFTPNGTGYFDSFVTLFNDTVTAVKAASPTTKIFTVWSLEKMKGLNGGLFGGKNDTSKNEWSLLAKLSQADFFAFTTYPGIIYPNPQDIPADYYTDIKNHTTKDIAFSEIGWPSVTPARGYDSSEAMQSQFITRFGELTSGLNPTFKIWSFLYDQAVADPFTTMGLISPAGVKKQAYTTWTNLK